MTKILVGLQMYTLRDLCAKNFLGTLEKVAEIGYSGVELAGLYSVEPPRVRETLDSLGLKCIGTHMGGSSIEQIAEVNHQLGSSYVWGPCLPKGRLPENREECIEMAQFANENGRKLKDEGIQLVYHNHSKEFEKIDGRYIMDWLLEETDPRYVQAEIDVMWGQYAGLDPASYILKYPGRVPLVHVKDMDENKEFTEVGRGVLDFDSIFDACEKVGSKWYIVEQDICRLPPLESVRRSYQFFVERGMV